MAERYNFKYLPLVGKLPGKSMVEQTETAINELASVVYDNAGHVGNLAEEVQTANTNASNALDKATEALETSGRVYIKLIAAVDVNDYYDSELYYINNDGSTNIPVRDRGFLEVKTNDDKTACEQVFIADSTGTPYYRHGRITEQTLGEETTYVVTWGSWYQGATAEYVQAELQDYLPLSGGTLTGVVNGVTPPKGDNSKKLATTAFVTATAKAAIGHYNSVAEMRKSETAIVGRPYVTLGYYNPNDGGGAVYIIRQKKESDTDDGGSTIILDNENVAELIIDGGINVKQFGAHGNGTDNDTVAFKKAISFASSNGNNILIPQGKYKVTTIEIPANVSLYGFGASIYSDSDIAFDIKSNTNADRSFIANINFYAKNPIVIEWGRKVTIKECSFHNVTGIGIYVKSGYEHDIRDCDFYGVGKNSIAIRMGTGDCRINNCIIIDCYLGIKLDDNINCYISNVHAWIRSPSLLRGSVMFDCGNSFIWIDKCYADTYHYVFSKKEYRNVTFNELFVSYNRGIWNQGMNADERPILTTASDPGVLVSVKMVGCNLLWGMKVNDSNGNFTGYIDDSSIVKNGNEAKYAIPYDTTLVEGTDSSKLIIRGGVILINIACKLLKNTKSIQCIGTIPYPAAFNATVTFTGVVCETETSSPVGIAYMRIVNNKIYVLTNADYTGKILCASTTLYTCRPTWD